MNGRQFSSHLRNAIIVAISLSVSTFAMAVGLGPIKVDSYIGQPLDATIKVNGLSPAAAERTTVQLASVSDYQSRGIAKLPSHDNLRFTLAKSGNGYLIDVTSTSGVREPFINFLLTINSDGGNITREYAVFLNPDPAQVAGITSNRAPSVTPQSSSKTESVVNDTVPTTVQIQPASAKTQGWGGNLEGAKPVPLTATSSNTVTSQNVAMGASTYGPIKPGETLYSIATKFRPSESVSLNRVMRAIYRNNRSAFATRNMDSLMAGYTLTIPDLNAISSQTGSAPVTASKPKSKPTQSVKPAVSNESDDTNISSEPSQSSSTAATAAIANANSSGESVLENLLEEDGINEEEAIDEQESADKVANTDDQIETENQEPHVVGGLVADLIPGVKSEDGVINSENMAPPEEEMVSTEEEALLDGQLTLDSPDSLEVPEQMVEDEIFAETPMVEDTQPIVEDEASNDTLIFGEAPTEDVQKNESRETEAEGDESAASEESVIENTTVENTPTDNAPTAVDADATPPANADTNQAETDTDKEPFLPIWMMALIGGLIILLGLLGALLYKKKKNTSSESDMSEEEIAEMLAALEEDESLKESLNFDQLTENLSKEEFFDDISDEFNFEQDNNIENNFDAIAKEAEMLRKSSDNDMLYVDDTSSKQSNSIDDDEEVDLDFDFGKNDESTSSMEETNIAFTPAIDSQNSDTHDEGFDDLFSLDTEESNHSTMTAHESPVSATEQTDSDDEMFDFDFDEEELSNDLSETPNSSSDLEFDFNDEKPSNDLFKTSDSVSDLEFDFDDKKPHNSSSETTDSAFDIAFDFSMDEEKDQIEPTVSTTTNDTTANDTSSIEKTNIDSVELSEAMEINLDLANSFIVTGSVDKAKEWLNEVMAYGNEDQKARAQQMLNKIK